MFEHHTAKLLPYDLWVRRLLRFTGLGAAIIVFGLGTGTLGYHYFAGFGWLDSALNASMILTGMGPVDHVDAAGGKVFAIIYSLFSGIVFLGTAAIVIAPWLHRFLHRLHADEGDD
jgi:hypothetical protein